MLLLAASIAGGTAVSLSDTLVGIARRNASLVFSAVAHATGLPGQKTVKRYQNGWFRETRIGMRAGLPCRQLAVAVRERLGGPRQVLLRPGGLG